MNVLPLYFLKTRFNVEYFFLKDIDAHNRIDCSLFLKEEIMLILQNVRYTHPNRDILFDNVNLAINRYDKIALIGNNGFGKSTLLKIMAGKLLPSFGMVAGNTQPYYVPQHFGQFNQYTIAQALGIEEKLVALKEILDGNVTDENMTVLDDDWGIEERCNEALSHWQLDSIDLFQKMGTLSGGQKTKAFLAGIDMHRPQLVLLDEPSNHLDATGRNILYNYIQSTTDTLVIVSHDRKLLNLLDTMCELNSQGITSYGGNYDFYKDQKAIEANALAEDLDNKEKELRKAKATQQAAIERQQKLDARGKKKQEKAGLPTISMNTLRNKAEKSTSKMKDVHAGRVSAMANDVDRIRKELPDKDKIRIGFDSSLLHTGKILVAANKINYSYDADLLWAYPLTFQITNGERISFKGANGSGKTTLVKIILGLLQPSSGTIYRADNNTIYIDQDYSLVDNALTIYEQVQKFNTGHLQEHEVKSRLTHFLFTKEYWDKQCATLSGGEKMRLVLCCLTISQLAPDMIVLDEPTNNLDIQNVEILTAAINDYKGTLLVISHDAVFLEQIGVEKMIELS